jgi:hypothetical protein
LLQSLDITDCLLIIPLRALFASVGAVEVDVEFDTKSGSASAAIRTEATVWIKTANWW